MFPAIPRFAGGRAIVAVGLAGLVAAATAGLVVAVHAAPPTAAVPPAPQRYGSVIELRPEKIAEYKRLHAAVWPEVAQKIREVNIRNYSIYLRRLPDGRYYLFAYFEYVGRDFKADMVRMAADPNTKRWWALTDPCQKPLDDREPGQWWASMQEVFHQD